jgi:hypothetical protein
MALQATRLPAERAMVRAGRTPIVNTFPSYQIG